MSLLGAGSVISFVTILWCKRFKMSVESPGGSSCCTCSKRCSKLLSPVLHKPLNMSECHTRATSSKHFPCTLLRILFCAEEQRVFAPEVTATTLGSVEDTSWSKEHEYNAVTNSTVHLQLWTIRGCSDCDCPIFQHYFCTSEPAQFSCTQMCLTAEVTWIGFHSITYGTM